MEKVIALIFGGIFIYIAFTVLSSVTNQLSEIKDATTVETVEQTEAQEVNTDEVSETSNYTTGLSALSSVIPIVFAAMIILGVVKAMGGIGDSGVRGTSVVVKIEKNKKSLVLRVEKAANKLEEYFNNLDEILGIKTIVKDVPNKDAGLDLSNNTLMICNGDTYYDWYLTDKHPDMNIFKVVGLHKEDRTKNLVYVLGNNGQKPYLINIPSTYVEEDIKLCLESAKVS